MGSSWLILAHAPPATLPSRSGQAVVELMREVPKEGQRAVALVTHDTRIFNVVDRVIQMEDGRLAG